MAPRCDTLTTLSPLTNGFDDDISTRAIWNIAGHDKGGALEWKRSGRSWPFADTISPGSSSDPEVRSCKNLLQIWSSAARHLSPLLRSFFPERAPYRSTLATDSKPYILFIFHGMPSLACRTKLRDLYEAPIFTGLAVVFWVRTTDIIDPFSDTANNLIRLRRFLFLITAFAEILRRKYGVRCRAERASCAQVSGRVERAF